MANSLVWPCAIVIAWVVGEFGQRWTRLPSISFYGLVGFVLATTQSSFLPLSDSEPILALADVAFGLILFELGYRINVRWLLTNPWIGLAGLVEALATFGVVYLIASAFNVNNITALMLASLAMATSPASLVRVINEQRSSGQVTERVLHLTALNCMLAVFAFNIVIGLWIFRSSGDIAEATLNSLITLLLSLGIGAVLGVIVPGMLRLLGNSTQDATVAFALGLILLVSLTYTAKLSPEIGALAFGLVARHRRTTFSQTQRNFGALGELLTVLLFVYAASTLDWHKAMAGAALALVVLVARMLTKTLCVTLFSHLSGVSWRKGWLTGLSLAPLSIFAILVLEHARLRGVIVADELRAMAAVTMMLEVFGPLLIQSALDWARETPHPPESRDAT